MKFRAAVVTIVTLSGACLLGACGNGDGGSATDVTLEEVPADREMAGYPSDPAPTIGDVTLPDLTADGADFAMKASPGNLLVVYFGYTNCPDFCPTTMFDVKQARLQLSQPDRIEVAMVSVDPGRDAPVLADYVTSFVPEAHALTTDDTDALHAAADPLGVSFEVRTAADGSVEVGHTTSLYALDDTGTLVLTWPFGVSVDDLARDFAQLLNKQAT